MCLVDERGQLSPVGHLLAANSKTIALAGNEAKELLSVINYTAGHRPAHLFLSDDTQAERVFFAHCGTTGGVAPTIMLTPGWRLAGPVGKGVTALTNDAAALKINLHVNSSFSTSEREASWLARSSHGFWLTGSPADKPTFVRVMSHTAMNGMEVDC